MVDDAFHEEKEQGKVWRMFKTPRIIYRASFPVGLDLSRIWDDEVQHCHFIAKEHSKFKWYLQDLTAGWSWNWTWTSWIPGSPALFGHPCFPKLVHWPGSISITRDLVKNADPRPHLNLLNLNHISTDSHRICTFDFESYCSTSQIPILYMDIQS